MHRAILPIGRACSHDVVPVSSRQYSGKSIPHDADIGLDIHPQGRACTLPDIGANNLSAGGNMLSNWRRSAVLAVCLAVFCFDASAQNVFVSLKDPDFLTNVNGLFTTGGQYRDPNNGVLQDNWSMLVRWQGDLVSNTVSYDLGAFTSFHVPQPTYTWQRGQQPENAAGTPGVQLYGYRAGMLINTWTIPHISILGGGYNDMYGYAWSSGRRPDAFVMHNSYGAPIGPAHLVLQASMAVPWFGSWSFVNGAWAYGQEAQSGQLSLFAYLEDKTRPDLPPIAIIGETWDSRSASCPANGKGFVGFDYPTGVWFGSAALCNTDITSVFYLPWPTQTGLFSDERFFRVHITPTNWQNLIARINSAGPANSDPSLRCTPGASCPPTGYSSDPGNYSVQYAGIIAELALIENGITNTASPNRQASMGVDIYGVGVYSSR
jgi:hypothetical protein